MTNAPIARGIRPHETPLHSVHRIADAAAVAVGLYIALLATPVGYEAGHTLANEWVAVLATAVLVLHAVAELTGLYRSWRGARLLPEVGCIVMTWGYTVGVMLGIGLVTTYNLRFTYLSKIIVIAGVPLVMAITRVVLRGVQHLLHRRGMNTRRVAIVGANELGVQLGRNLQQSPGLGLRVEGYYDDRPEDRRTQVPGELGPTLGNVDQLVEQAKSGGVDTVYITFPMRAEERIREVLARLSDTTASVYIVPDFFVFELMNARWTSIDGLPAVSLCETPLQGVDGLAKRMADLTIATGLLVALSVPMALIAAAVKLTSRGPAFFRQKRYGLDGREILVWKFRSMRTEDNGPVVRQATKNDSRITPLGAVLRRTSLDELPQLFNVIEGTMSLVGPRPHATAHNEQYRSLIDGYMLRHKVKPGITGLAQVRGFRGETDTLDKMEGRVRFDLEYIRGWSLMMDLKILFQTVFVVLRQENAY
ncbi:MAG: undecaprenyl-phosphate glucose phosphotransferase [Planctomycetota bacterium]